MEPLIQGPSESDKAEISEFLDRLGATSIKEQLTQQSWSKKSILENLLALWLWKYEPQSDVMRHWEIVYPPLDEAEQTQTKDLIDLLKDGARVKSGWSSVGVLSWTGQREILNDTADDPRSSVSVEDYLIRDYSWVAIPVKQIDDDEKAPNHAESKVLLAVTFFLPYINAWNNKEDTKKDVKQVVDKFKDELRHRHRDDTLTEEISRSIEIAGFISGEESSILKVIEQSRLISPSLAMIFTSVGNEWVLPNPDYLYTDTNEVEHLLLQELLWCSLAGQHSCDTCPLRDPSTASIGFMGRFLCGVDDGLEVIPQQERSNRFILRLYTINRPINQANDTAVNVNEQINALVEDLGNLLSELWEEEGSKHDVSTTKRLAELRKGLFDVWADFVFNGDEKKLKEKCKLYEPVEIEIPNGGKVKPHNKLSEFYQKTPENKISYDTLRYSILGIEYWEIVDDFVSLNFVSSNGECPIRCANQHLLNAGEGKPIHVENEGESYLKHPGTLLAIERAGRILLKKGEQKAKEVLDDYPPLLSLFKHGKIEAKGDSGKSYFHIEWRPQDSGGFSLSVYPKEEKGKTYVPRSIRLHEETLRHYLWRNWYKQKELTTYLSKAWAARDATQQSDQHPAGSKMLESDELERMSPRWEKYRSGYWLWDRVERVVAVIMDVSSVEKGEEEWLKRLGDRLFEAFRIRRAERKATVQAASSAILTESYAHNMGAHALDGLTKFLHKQWTELRGVKAIHENLTKKSMEELAIQEQESLYSSVLGAFQSVAFNADVETNVKKEIGKLLKSHAGFIEYLNYLKGKSAFWNAISRGGHLYGGEVRSCWELIEDFMKNYLLCGSLVESDGIEEIEFTCHIGNQDQDGIVLGTSGVDGYKPAGAETIKKTLQDADIYLPEGVVGQQAVYTIWENVIRNVKHCKLENGDKKPLPFHIRFDQLNKKTERIQITVWIQLSGQKNPEEVMKKVEGMKNWSGVLSKNGRPGPNMGGTSQNVLCAGMVRGLSFWDVDRRQRMTDKPVIEFVYDHKLSAVTYRFEIWKGKPLAAWEGVKKGISNLEDVAGRYKIILVQSSQLDEYRKEHSPIRHRVINDPNSIDQNDKNTFGQLYQQWVQEFVLNERIYRSPLKIHCEYFGEDQVYLFSKNMFYQASGWAFNNAFNFYHRDRNKKDDASTHAQFKKDGFVGKFNNMNAENGEALRAEFVEIVGTMIDIFDDRLKSHVDKVNTDQEGLLNRLYVEAFNEKEEAIQQSRNPKHFLVIHLSFIEELTTKRNKDAVEAFFSNHSSVVQRYEYVIVTTGRGRDWLTGLTEKVSEKVRFIPIENLERCFEYASRVEPYSPALGAKYLLTKAIYGS